MTVGAHFGCFGQAAQHLGNTPIAGFEHDGSLRPECALGPGNLGLESPGIRGIVDLDIVHAATAGDEFVPEVAHRGKEVGDAFLVLGDV